MTIQHKLILGFKSEKKTTHRQFALDLSNTYLSFATKYVLNCTHNKASGKWSWGISNH